MKNVWVLTLILFVKSGIAKERVERLEGYIFSFQGKDFVTEHLGTTFPQFLLQWKDADSKEDLCLSRKPGKCPAWSSWARGLVRVGDGFYRSRW